MPRELAAYFQDLDEAISDIVAFTQGKSLVDYQSDRLLRAGVERKFGVIGEALKQMVHHYRAPFPECRKCASSSDFAMS